MKQQFKFLLALLLMISVMTVSFGVAVTDRDAAPDIIWYDDSGSTIEAPETFIPYNPVKVPIQGSNLTVLRFYDDYQNQSTSTSVQALASTDAEIPNPGDIVGGIRDSKSWTDLIGLEAMIYTFLITIGGWFSAFIPGLKNIDNGVFRVLTWAVLVIGGGLAIGFGNVWVGAISYFFSTSLYEVVLKWLVPSPKPKP